MGAYTVNVPITEEQNARLTFLATKRGAKRRTVAYDLFTTALAAAVVGDRFMYEEYKKWLDSDAVQSAP